MKVPGKKVGSATSANALENQTHTTSFPPIIDRRCRCVEAVRCGTKPLDATTHASNVLERCAPSVSCQKRSTRKEGQDDSRAGAMPATKRSSRTPDGLLRPVKSTRMKCKIRPTLLYSRQRSNWVTQQIGGAANVRVHCYGIRLCLSFHDGVVLSTV
jgi:hypothetical protein